MRKVHLLIIAMFVLGGCKKAEQTTGQASAEEQDLITMRGEFIYDNGAAVLQTPQTIYGVVQNEAMEHIRKEIRSQRSSNIEMAMITVKARRIAKPDGEEGWPYSIEIKELIKIEQVGSDGSGLIELSK